MTNLEMVAAELEAAKKKHPERDRLRDLVRRLLMLRRGDIAVPMLRVASAAIGEEK